MTRESVTLQDVARAAGVSVTTASRVVNNGPHVRGDVRARVQEAVDRLGYQPNHMARGLRGGRDATIGVVVDSLADIFFATIVDTIEGAAVPRGLTVTVATSGREPAREEAAVARFLKRQVSGLIVVPTTTSPAYLGSISDAAPVVFVDRPVDAEDFDAIIGDDHAGGVRATRHLLQHGHRRIAMLSDSTTLHTSRRRVEGFRHAMAQQGVPVDESLVVTSCARTRDAVAATEALLDRDDPPTAIFSSNARCTIGVVSVLHRRHRTDIAVVGFGDFPLADAVEPAVTVLDQDPVSVATAAARRLLERLDGVTSPPATVVVPSRLIERGTGELPCVRS